MLSVCAVEYGSKKGWVLKTLLKYQLKISIYAVRCLMRNGPEKLNCPGPFSPWFKHNVWSGNWQCNNIFWCIFWAICHFCDSMCRPSELHSSWYKKHQIEMTGMDFAWPCWRMRGKKCFHRQTETTETHTHTHTFSRSFTQEKIIIFFKFYVFVCIMYYVFNYTQTWILSVCAAGKGVAGLTKV